MQDINQIKTDALQLVANSADIKQLEEIRVQFLGKNGSLTAILKTLGKLEPEQRKKVASETNEVKSSLVEAIEAKKQALELAELEQKLASEKLDLTLPATPYKMGKMHPVSYVVQELEEIFAKLGFSVATSQEIENEYFNFTALNIPPEHPARQDHDTFYFNEFTNVEGCPQRKLLRTQTSNTQIHAMRAKGAPLRVVCPGRVYRCDSDLTHTPQFHQIEGLAVDTNITMADLKGVLQLFLSEYFERDVKMRFRPSYFPFTEPSTEVDIQCVFCNGEGCRVCKQTGFIEVLGAGMVNEKVLLSGGIDPNKYQGFAFGAGIERLAMLKYGINDLRMFFESQAELLKHFGKNV